MMTKLRLALASLFSILMIGAGISVASPAQAASGGTCSLNSFCLYQWNGFGAQVANDRWQTSFQNLANQGCINLGNAAWANGTLVRDNSASMAWYGSSQWAGWTIGYHNWANCQDGGGWGNTTYLNVSGQLDPLSGLTYPSAQGTNISLYHTITSISILRRN